PSCCELGAERHHRISGVPREEELLAFIYTSTGSSPRLSRPELRAFDVGVAAAAPSSCDIFEGLKRLSSIPPMQTAVVHRSYEGECPNGFAVRVYLSGAIAGSPRLAVPGVGPDTFVTIGRNKCDLIKSIFPTEWRLGVAKVGEGPFQYPHDVADEERAFAFAREAIMKSRPGVL
ncbi:hypothetical protein FOZ63_018509, partial [Perkinsus olseni]